ncbi:MAG: alpha/beta hydrolase-fold protein [Chitinophagaceae bacterium]
MQLLNGPGILAEKIFINSVFLQREVEVDFFLPKNVDNPSQLNLLLINDGQNLGEMNFQSVLENFYDANLIEPILCVGIYAGSERKMEYGVSSQPDYLGRGASAGLYSSFVLEELLPFIYKNYSIISFKEKAIAGFSLGALMALDIAWNHPDQFSKAGLFSGSFWWRSVDQDDPAYDDDKHRIMQQEIKNGSFYGGVKFFFQCGNKDETMDRNNNGIIDSIDDTMAVIDELIDKGYNRDNDIYYLEMPKGKHDLPTWAEAMPLFLKWGWGR